MTAPEQQAPPGWREQLSLRAQLARRRLCEYLGFDSFVFRKLVALVGITVGQGLLALGKKCQALKLWSALHRGAYARWADRLIQRWARKAATREGALLAQHVEGLQPQPATEAFFKAPARLIGTRILVLKSPGANEKGVIALDYFFVFPLFAKLFDVRAIARRYY